MLTFSLQTKSITYFISLPSRRQGKIIIPHDWFYSLITKYCIQLNILLKNIKEQLLSLLVLSRPIFLVLQKVKNRKQLMCGLNGRMIFCVNRKTWQNCKVRMIGWRCWKLTWVLIFVTEAVVLVLYYRQVGRNGEDWTTFHLILNC